MTIAERDRILGFHSGVVRNVTQRELPEALALARREPEINGFVISRIQLGLVDHWRLGGALWGYFIGDHLSSMLFVGANIVPVNTDFPARQAFASELMRTGRRSSSILGNQNEVLDLWEQISLYWGKARAIREAQPFLSMNIDPLGAIDSRVRTVLAREIDLLFPACVDMFTQEVGISPIANGGEIQYKRRVAQGIDLGMTFAVIENDEVHFKAEIGFATDSVAQLQGVWVNPKLRGSGIAVPALSAVIAAVRAKFAPTVTLYVNDFNTPARKTYERVGFQQLSLFSTVLF
jgi:uncharacterized protein